MSQEIIAVIFYVVICFVCVAINVCDFLGGITMLAKCIFVCGIIFLLNSDVYGSQIKIFDPDLLQIQELIGVRERFDRSLQKARQELTMNLVAQVAKNGISDIFREALLLHQQLVIECIQGRQQQMSTFYEGKANILLQSIQKKLLDNL